jgi:putative transposase
MRHHFVVMLREDAGRDASPTAAITDTQSVKTTQSGGPRGWDAAKRLKGRKRHIAVDTDGLLLGILVHAADSQDADGLGDLLKRLKPLYVWRQAMFADSIYNRLAALLACYLAGLVLIIVRRPAGTTGFVVQPRRWVVERSLGWSGDDGAGYPSATRRCPRSPRQCSPWPRSASCCTASPIPIAGDCPPHNSQNGLQDSL